MSDNEKSGHEHEIVIVKRRGGHDDGHHGGAWKIAYADFMTAMMAFFLVLWLVNSTTQEGRNSISRYFNPIKMVDSSVSKKGLDTNKEAEPGKESTGTGSDEVKKEGKESIDKADRPMPSQKEGKPSIGDPLGAQGLFANPEIVLSEIAARPDPVVVKAPAAHSARGSDLNGAAWRDPFKPMTRRPIPGPTLDAEDRLELPPTMFRQEKPGTEPSSPDADKAAASVNAAVNAAAAPEPASRVAVPSDHAQTPMVPAQTPPAPASVEKEAARLKDDLARSLARETAAGSAAPQLDVKATAEGILISMNDDESYGMFDVGSVQPQPKVVRMMQKIGEALKEKQGLVIIRGHTDARPFRNGAYDNWRLSSDRAQVARLMLIRGGMPEGRIEHVEGWADRRLKLGDRPDAPENRRIEILLRRPSS